MIDTKGVLHALLSAPLSVLALATPKEPGLTVCVPRFLRGYDGNVKYFFLHLCQHGRDRGYHPLLLTEQNDLARELEALGLPVLRHPSRESLQALLRADFLIVEAEDGSQLLEGVIARGARKIQLWHGNGLKVLSRMRRALEEHPLLKPLVYAGHVIGDRHSRYEVMCFCSERQREIRREAFRFRHDLLNGQPRCDVLFHPVEGEEAGTDADALRRIHQARADGLAVALYSPTWRKAQLRGPLDVLDLQRLEEHLARIGVLLVVKLHPKDPADVPPSPHIVVHQTHRDVYPAMRDIDLMITDYSSIYTDFLLMDKPVAFFTYDEDTYQASRKLMHDLDDVACGPRCATQDELEAMLERWRTDGLDEFAEQRRTTVRMFNHYIDGDASARLLDFLDTLR